VWTCLKENYVFFSVAYIQKCRQTKRPAVLFYNKCSDRLSSMLIISKKNTIINFKVRKKLLWNYTVSLYALWVFIVIYTKFLSMEQSLSGKANISPANKEISQIIQDTQFSVLFRCVCQFLSCTRWTESTTLQLLL